jgi:hypothetical protein
MPIVKSTITEDRQQVDGRRSIHEVHVDHLGEHYAVDYIAESGDDVQASLTARAAQIEADLTAAEIAANLLEAGQP